MRATLISVLVFAFGAEPSAAESVVATRLIRAGDVIAFDDLVQSAEAYSGAVSTTEDAIGLEAKVTLFPGRPINPGDLGPPRLVRRNEIVSLVFRSGAIEIRAEGRSLSDGTSGAVVQVMNLDSRTRLSGVVSDVGEVIVSKRN